MMKIQVGQCYCCGRVLWAVSVEGVDVTIKSDTVEIGKIYDLEFDSVEDRQDQTGMVVEIIQSGFCEGKTAKTCIPKTLTAGEKSSIKEDNLAILDMTKNSLAIRRQQEVEKKIREIVTTPWSRKKKKPSQKTEKQENDEAELNIVRLASNGRIKKKELKGYVRMRR